MHLTVSIYKGILIHWITNVLLTLDCRGYIHSNPPSGLFGSRNYHDWHLSNALPRGTNQNVVGWSTRNSTRYPSRRQLLSINDSVATERFYEDSIFVELAITAYGENGVSKLEKKDGSDTVYIRQSSQCEDTRSVCNIGKIQPHVIKLDQDMRYYEGMGNKGRRFNSIDTVSSACNTELCNNIRDKGANFTQKGQIMNTLEANVMRGTAIVENTMHNPCNETSEKIDLGNGQSLEQEVIHIDPINFQLSTITMKNRTIKPPVRAYDYLSKLYHERFTAEDAQTTMRSWLNENQSSQTTKTLDRELEKNGAPVFIQTHDNLQPNHPRQRDEHYPQIQDRTATAPNHQSPAQHMQHPTIHNRSRQVEMNIQHHKPQDINAQRTYQSQTPHQQTPARHQPGGHSATGAGQRPGEAHVPLVERGAASISTPPTTADVYISPESGPLGKTANIVVSPKAGPPPAQINLKYDASKGPPPKELIIRYDESAGPHASQAPSGSPLPPTQSTNTGHQPGGHSGTGPVLPRQQTHAGHQPGGHPGTGASDTQTTNHYADDLVTEKNVKPIFTTTNVVDSSKGYVNLRHVDAIKSASATEYESLPYMEEWITESEDDDEFSRHGISNGIRVAGGVFGLCLLIAVGSTAYYRYTSK